MSGPAPIPADHPTTPRWSDVLAALHRGLTTHSLALVWIPAPRLSAASVFAHTPGRERVAWSDPNGNDLVGAGAAALVTASGPLRWREARDRIDALLSDVSTQALAAAQPWTPRALAGFAFAPATADIPPWQGFGDARLVLPELVYRREGSEAQLGALATRDLPTNAVHALVGRLARWYAQLHRGDPTAPPQPSQVVPPPASDLSARIDAALQAITTGPLEKVVVADRYRVELPERICPALVFQRLAAESPTATRFAFEIAGRCFLGASPERLVSRRSRRVQSEALAGSAHRDDPGAAERLLRSQKDLVEHAYVARAIEHALRPLCVSLEMPATPVLRSLRRVVHLNTPIVGVLKQDVHLLDLVGLLHPTPAVAGNPPEEAVSWILAHERRPRGWYSGPVGWVEPNGDGDFYVALRSGVLHDNVAELFAGAGIVQGSVRAAEVAEIELKLATFRAALGIDLP